MQRVGRILERFVGEYGLKTGLTLATIKKQWARLVGQTLAVHTSPDTIKGKTIFIVVDTPQWMHHLSFYKQGILEKLEPFEIDKIRFRIGKLNNEEHSNGLKSADISQLTEEDLRYIENTLRNFKDTELKEKLRSLLTNALRHGKR